jgi:Zn-dependent metalloprotease
MPRTTHHPSILPPHLLRSIASRGSAHQRRAALLTLATDQTFRTLRAALPRRTAARRPLAPGPGGTKVRTVFDAHQRQELPGEAVRSEGGRATGDAAVDEAYDGLGATFDFFWSVFQRNSIDGDGLHLEATVHFGRDYDNGFWNGERMVFGDGDGELFNRFTIALEVIGHELTHGVTQDEAGLLYLFQPGALNESISDVFGSLVKQHSLRQTAEEADWLIGKGLLTRRVQGVALRSMKAPGTAFDDPVLGKDPQPAHMRDYLQTYQDQGGVHINSGIPNHAFYILAAELGGHAWEKAGRIWYETLRDPRVEPSISFAGFARRTVANASRLYGERSAERKAVAAAWAEVGVESA